MPRFEDKDGVYWDVMIDVPQVEKLRETGKIDLMMIDRPEGRAMFEDPVTFVHAMFLLCEEQAVAKQIDEKAFGRKFDGDTIDRAVDALLEAVGAFFPRHRRTILQRSGEKAKQLQDQMLAKATATIDTLDLEKLIAMTPSKPPTSSAE